MACAPYLRASSVVAVLVLVACGSSRKNEEGAGGTHPAGYDTGTVHGPDANADLGSCQSCHGADFDGTGGFAPSCNACHTTAGFASWASNCTFCHGTQKVTAYTAADLPKAAPATGAHAKHVNGGVLSGAMACAECHTVPTTLAHANGLATVVFGTLARTGGATPTFASPTCSSVYCHGNSPGLESPTLPNPAWNGPSMLCGNCHDLQPASGQHTLHLNAGAVCQTCHKGYSTIDFANHVNGTAEAVLFDDTEIPGWEAADCTACHTKLGVVL